MEEKCMLYEHDFNDPNLAKYCFLSPQRENCPYKGILKNGVCEKHGLSNNDLFEKFTENLQR